MTQVILIVKVHNKACLTFIQYQLKFPLVIVMTQVIR